MTISDEDLARVCYEAFPWADEAGTDQWDDLSESDRLEFYASSRAVRAALTEPVTPLAPGETVRVPDRDLAGWEDAGIFVAWRAEGALDVTATVGGSEVGITLALDAGGVRALIQAGRRWLAAQECDHD